MHQFISVVYRAPYFVFLRSFNAHLYLEKGVIAVLRAHFWPFSVLREDASYRGNIQLRNTDFLKGRGSSGPYNFWTPPPFEWPSKGAPGGRSDSGERDMRVICEKICHPYRNGFSFPWNSFWPWWPSFRKIHNAGTWLVKKLSGSKVWCLVHRWGFEFVPIAKKYISGSHSAKFRA